MMARYQRYCIVLLAGILITGVVAVGARYRREMNAARAALDGLGSQVIETDCGPIEYARTGEGYPVLAVHGSFGGFDAGLQLAQPALDAGYQVISVSRFGYLRTPLPEHASVDLQADAYVCLLDELGIRQAAVMTASGGATSTLRFAARYPERVSALILVSPAAPGEVIADSPPEIAFTLMRSDFFYWTLITYFRPVALRMIGVPESFALTAETEKEASAILPITLPSGGRINGFAFDCTGVSTEFNEEIAADSPYSAATIHAPVLVFSALDDPLALPQNVRGLAEKFPNARLVVLPDGGHVLLGHSEEIGAEIAGFLGSQVAALDGR